MITVSPYPAAAIARIEERVQFGGLERKKELEKDIFVLSRKDSPVEILGKAEMGDVPLLLKEPK